MRFLRKGWTAALMLALATPVAAQEHEVARRTFTFIENDLTIEVVGHSPGALHIVRGQPGQIEVAARAKDGIAGFGLAGEARNRLKLTAVGAERVTFLVVVPSELRVRVELPEQPVAEIFGSLDQAASRAGSAPRRRRLRDPRPRRRRPTGPRPPASWTRGSTFRTPDSARPGPSRSRTPCRCSGSPCAGRAGSSASRATARSACSKYGSNALELEADGRATELVLSVPATTRDFVLRVGDSPALVVKEGQAAVLCSPVIDQTLDGSRRWFTFTPENGKLACRGSRPGGNARSAD